MCKIISSRYNTVHQVFGNMHTLSWIWLSSQHLREFRAVRCSGSRSLAIRPPVNAIKPISAQKKRERPQPQRMTVLSQIFYRTAPSRGRRRHRRSAGAAPGGNGRCEGVSLRRRTETPPASHRPQLRPGRLRGDVGGDPPALCREPRGGPELRVPPRGEALPVLTLTR